jgi:hypothetical protein
MICGKESRNTLASLKTADVMKQVDILPMSYYKDFSAS